MSVSPDEVRAATRLAAAVITPDTIPPLRLEESSSAHGRRTRSAWFAPLVAAAAVVIVVVGSVAVGSSLARSGNGNSGGPAKAPEHATPVGSLAGVPPYYVEVPNASSAVVRATATGATLDSITTRTPFVGVTGAADDRTFVLDAQRQEVGATVRWLGQPAFYLLRLRASGTIDSLNRLAIAPLPKGTAVTGLALSPDGGKLAVEVDTGDWGHPGLLEMRVYTLATGAYRTWSTNGSTDPEDPSGFTGSGVDGSATISWAADSKTLAFDWMNKSYIGVRLLDTTASGADLIADSRLAVIEAGFTSACGGQSVAARTPKAPDYISQCVTDGIISLDGAAIVCGYTTGSSETTTTGFIRYSTRTGKKAAVLGVNTFHGQAPGDISLYWVNSTGKILIGATLTPSGIRVGVINGETFTPLPGIAGGLGAAAW